MSVVRSGRVSTFFACAESQEFNSAIGSRNGTRHCALGPFVRPEFLTLLSVVQSESVIPIFDSTEPQEFNSAIGLRNGTRHCALGPILRPDFFGLKIGIHHNRAILRTFSEINFFFLKPP